MSTAGENPQYALNATKAIEIFNILAGLGYGVAIKHLRGMYFIEIPVTLKGDQAYGKQTEILQLAQRAGLSAIQTGQVMRIVGR